MTEDTVKWFNNRKSYGFITPEEGSDDIFVHFSVIGGHRSDFKSLYEGDKIKSEIIDGHKGPQAEKIEVIEQAPRQSYQSRGF